MEIAVLEHDNQTTADKLPSAYYDFAHYVSRERMTTFWYQLREAFATNPSSVLEIGVGPKIVAGALRENGIDVRTADINSALRPDYVLRAQDLTSRLSDDSFDLIVCARVLHHVPFQDFERCLEQLWRVTRKSVILTLPVEDLRIYARFRITSLRSIGLSLRLPVVLKKTFCKVFPGRFDTEYRRKWKIGSEPAASLKKIEALLAAHFNIEKSYGLPEDRGHHIFVLTKRREESR
ncbi:MAG: class I SAM-dependent methyltransferase [Armatimonadota bacterium]|nr:class I SAM-dependent methyltransferase [Armatimonadota bacterium]